MVFSISAVLHSGCESVCWTRSSVWAQLIVFLSSRTVGVTYCNAIVQWQAKSFSSRREILPSVWNLLYKDMQNVGFCFVISKFKQLPSLHEFSFFLMHLHSHMEQMITGHGLLSLCLHIVTNDVQCSTYLFDPFRIFCALVGTEKCTIYCLSQDPFLKTWDRQICTYFWFCVLILFLQIDNPLDLSYL